MPTTTTTDPDLLPNIGNPARHAMAMTGCTHLDQAAALSEPELLALHGFGPKALRILREALTACGLTFADAPKAGKKSQSEHPD